MFNRKKVKELSKEINELKQKNHVLINEVNQLDLLVANSKPVEVKTYTIDAINLAKELKRYPKKGGCSSGNCGTSYYMIPTKMIDIIASK